MEEDTSADTMCSLGPSGSWGATGCTSCDDDIALSLVILRHKKSVFSHFSAGHIAGGAKGGVGADVAAAATGVLGVGVAVASGS